MFLRAGNIQQRTSNAQHRIENKPVNPRLIGCSEFDVECSMFSAILLVLLLDLVLVIEN
jgi:hypothetical protein